ncbi:PAS domain S-box protein [Haematospirillum sp. 15-248]|uniref:sensor histidine kinase n=1 Tax=Haematospirillum sp. 15-248 TaxID=2723107 RepID=UPI00143AB0B4|nr:histidine kinase dimerization/phospho-acceptor domain-containing protein [Haematospirillum sp. 15-248]NKD87439.1 PAS domain S-box protein [Haematospirillum sp. 15-248]
MFPSSASPAFPLKGMSLRSVVMVASIVMLVTVAGASLAILLAFSRTISLAEETEGRIIPEVLGQQTLAVLAAELARTAEVVLGTNDPVRRDKALLTAERTAVRFAPLAGVDSMACLDTALSAIRRSAYLRDLADTLAVQRVGIQVRLVEVIIPVRPVNALWSQIMLELQSLLARVEAEQDMDRLQALQVHISAARNRLLALYKGSSPCLECPEIAASLLQDILSVVDLRREQLAVLVQADKEASQTRVSLEHMTANLSRTAANTVRNSAAAIVEAGWQGIIMGSVLVCGSLVLILVGGLLLLRHVVRPAVRAREALDAIYSGDPLPMQEPASLKEFQVIGEAVQRLSCALGNLKDSEQNALRGRQQLEYLLDISPAPFMLVDLTSGLVSRVNAAAADLFGIRCDGLSGVMAEDLWVSHEAVSDVLSRLRNNDAVERLDMQFRRVAAPPFWALVSARTGALDGRAIALVGLADITDRKHYENRLRLLIDDLERSNRELEQFAHSIAHDLQDPLRAMVNGLQQIGHRAGDLLDESFRSDMGRVAEGGRRMERMIAELLDYSRIGCGGACEPVPLWDVVARVSRGLGPVLEECGAVLSVDGRLPSVAAHPEPVAGLFRNVLFHILDSRDPQHALKIVIRVLQAGAFCECVVAYNGHAAPISTHHDVAPHGDDTRPVVTAGGIGLSLCRRIVENYGGRLWIDPSGGLGPDGQDSAVHFTLPLHDPVSASEPQRVLQEASPGYLSP